MEKGLKLSPKQPQAQFEIAKLNLLPGGDPQKALEALDKTIALADDDAALRAEALVQRATLRNNPQQRLADLDEAVRTLPGNAVLLRHRGLVRAEAEKWDDALADFDKAIAADPKQVSTYQMKAQVLVKIKKPPEALAVLEKGHLVAPDNIDLLVAKGQILVAQIELQGRRRGTDPGAGHRWFESADPGTSGGPLRTIGRKGQGPGRRREDPGDQARTSRT